MQDILKRQSMQSVIEELKPNGQHIGERFFPMQEEVTDETIWDVVTPGNGIANLRAVDGEAKIMEGRSFDRKIATVTDFAAKRRLNISDLRILREPGELTQVPSSMLGQLKAKAERKITTSLADMRATVENRLEWMRINALLGAISYTDAEKNIKVSLDYGVPSGQENLSPSVSWATIATSNPINDIQTWKDTVADETGVVPSIMILSGLALSRAGQSTVIRDYFKYTNPILTASDIRKILEEKLEMEVVVYEARYTDASGTVQRFLAQNKLILAPNPDVLPIASKLGDTAYVPHAHNDYSGSYYVWQKEEKDPYGVEVGVGLTALPRVYQPRTLLNATLW